jgi:S-methylmethionine-dependent homocysteine/selenocysteine methylase
MSNNAELLRKALRERIVIIDGAMGTTIRTYGLGEAEIRGERFKDSKKDIKNNGDLYSLTQAGTICDIHRRFLEAGADIIETNFLWMTRASTAGAKILRFTRVSSRTNSSTTSPGKSTSSPPNNAANGATALPTKQAARASWLVPLGR